MKLYLLRGDLDYGWLQPVEPAAWRWRGGTPVSFKWQVPELGPLRTDGAHPFMAVDCLAMNTGCDGPILSEFAVQVLGRQLQQAGETWPVRVLGQRYWWFNCLASVEGLDPAKTDADWEMVDGEWGEFRWISLARQLAFKPE